MTLQTWQTDVLTPTAVAALVSGATLLAREAVCRLGRRRDLRERLAADGERSRGELAVQQSSLLLQQIQLLWTENAALKRAETECVQRHRELERRCRELEASCESLTRRLDGLLASVSPEPA